METENISKVTYVFGLVQEKINELLDFEEIYAFCVTITKDWEEFKDIQSMEEEGYIMPYAERKILERFSE